MSEIQPALDTLANFGIVVGVSLLIGMIGGLYLAHRMTR